MNSIRAKAWVGRNWKGFTALLVVLSLVFTGIAINTYLNPPVELREKITNEEEMSITTSTSTMVEEENELYNEGEVLTDYPVYFAQLTDKIRYHTHVTAPADTSTEIAVSSELILTGETANNEEFWSTSVGLNSSTATVVRPEQRVDTTQLNITEIQSTIAEKKAELDGSGVFSATIETTVEYNTGTYSGTKQLQSEVSVNGDKIRVETPSTTQRHTETQTVRAEQDGITQRVVLFGAGSGVTLAILILAVVYGPRIDANKLQYDIEHYRYEEWISEGEIPTSPNREPVKIANISDLVNAAIDMDKRVIYNDTYEVYGVITEDLLYYTAKQDELVGDWFELVHPEINNGQENNKNGRDESDIQEASAEENEQGDEYLELFGEEVADEKSDRDNTTKSEETDE